MLAWGFVAVGGAPVFVSSTPVVDAQVVSSNRDPAAGTWQVVLVAPDGSTTSTVHFSDPPGRGATASVMELPGNRLVEGGSAADGRDVGVVSLIIGVAIGQRAWWRTRHRDPPNRTLVVPGDTLVLPASQIPGGWAPS